jgi:aminopeptidase C
MDTALFEYEVGLFLLLLNFSADELWLFPSQNAFDITLGLSKADRLEICDSAMTHAMVITAVHLDLAGKPIRYKVENSWGETAGKEGYFVMTDAWFDQCVVSFAQSVVFDGAGC